MYVVNPNVPAKNLKEFIALVKARPGSMNYGSAGTGSAGHLGEALVRTLQQLNRDVTGLDIKPSPFTTYVGSITNRAFVQRCLAGISAAPRSG